MVHSVYCGEHVCGKRTTKARDLVSREVPAIIDDRVWQRTQDALRRNQSLSPHNAKRKYLLRGLVTCSICGLNYSGASVARSNGRRQAYLKCNGKDHFLGRLLGRCPSKMVRAEALESAIWDDIEGFLTDPGPILERLALSLRESQEHTDATTPERDVVAAALARKRDEKDSMLDLYRRQRIALPDLERQLEKIADEERQLGDRLTQMDAERLGEPANRSEGVARGLAASGSSGLYVGAEAGDGRTARQRHQGRYSRRWHNEEGRYYSHICLRW